MRVWDRAPVVLAWVALAFTSYSAAGVAEENLFPPAVLGVGQHAIGIATSDLDDDGWLDLVVASERTEFFFVFYGRGAGLFEPAVQVPVGLLHTGVLIVDLNGDQVDDIVVSGRTVSVFLGGGDRTFIAGESYLPWGYLVWDAIDAADFNGDGKSDVVVGGRGIVVYLSNGDGTLAWSDGFSASADSYIVTGDFNEDGAEDVLASGFNGRSLWLGAGDGTFFEGTAAGGGTDGAVGDLNNDGHLDLAIAGVSVLLGSGDGQFAAPVAYDSGLSPSNLTLADLNGDGNPDIVASEFDLGSSPEVAVHLSNGDGTFAPAARYVTPGLGGRMTAGDFNRDGAVDIAVASVLGAPGSDPEGKAVVTSVSVAYTIEGDGNGGLIPRRVQRFGETVARAESVAVGDFNGDGLQDTACANQNADTVSVFLGVGDGSFEELNPVPVGTAPSSLAIGEFGGGAHPDLAVANRDSSDVSILLGSGDGSFVSMGPFALGGQGGQAPEGLARGDFDGDGIQDLATANAGSNSVSVLRGLGDGSFALAADLPVGQTPRSLTVTDLDGEAGVDLVVANWQSDDVSVLLGDGKGSFAPEVRLPAGPRPWAIAADDLDGDGHRDVALAGTGDPALTVLYGDGNGGLSSPVPFQLHTTATDVKIADLNGDGRLDLAVGHGSFPMVSVLLGDASGFRPRLEFAGGSHGRLAVGEFNRDGRLDILESSFNLLAVLFNQAPVLLKFKTDKTNLTWPQLVGYDGFNVYRGNLTDLLDTNQDGLPDGGYGACRSDSDPDLTDNLFVDEAIPPPGEGFFYLMARFRDGAESELGSSSFGAPRVPSTSCP